MAEDIWKGNPNIINCIIGEGTNYKVKHSRVTRSADQDFTNFRVDDPFLAKILEKFHAIFIMSDDIEDVINSLPAHLVMSESNVESVYVFVGESRFIWATEASNNFISNLYGVSGHGNYKLIVSSYPNLYIVSGKHTYAHSARNMFKETQSYLLRQFLRVWVLHCPIIYRTVEFT